MSGMLSTALLATWLSLGPPSESNLVVEHQPGQGVRIAGANGRFSMQTWLRAQVRDTLLHDSGASPSLTQTLEARRASLFFAGNVFGPHNKYFVQLVFAPRDLGLVAGQVTQSPIFDLFFTFDHLRDLSVRVGQYKPMFSRQFIASWGDLQFVDRSIAQTEFYLDRDIGFDLFSNDLGGLDRFRYSIGVYAGHGRNDITPRALHMTYLARVEVLPFGAFDEYVEADLERRHSPKLALGAAYAYRDHARADRGVIGTVPADGGTTNFHEVAADTIFKVFGFSALAEFFWRQGQRNPGGALDETGVAIPVSLPRNGLGWFGQLGYVLPPAPVEFAVRGGQTHALGASSLASTNELGGGVSWYLHGHGLKLQADYFHLWSGDDLRDGNDQVRLQLQVSI